jgi:choline dehydrogenase
MALAAEMLRYVVTGRGIFTYSASLAAALVKGPGEIGDPDVQCSIAPAVSRMARSAPPDGRPSGLRPGGRRFPRITVGAWQMRPLSRGSRPFVDIRSGVQARPAF